MIMIVVSPLSRYQSKSISVDRCLQVCSKYKRLLKYIVKTILSLSYWVNSWVTKHIMS